MSGRTAQARVASFYPYEDQAACPARLVRDSAVDSDTQIVARMAQLSLGAFRYPDDVKNRLREKTLLQYGQQAESRSPISYFSTSVRSHSATLFVTKPVVDSPVRTASRQSVPRLCDTCRHNRVLSSYFRNLHAWRITIESPFYLSRTKASQGPGRKFVHPKVCQVDPPFQGPRRGAQAS